MVPKQNRRSFLGTLGASAAACALTPAARAAARKPNIVFLLADDLGWGDLGCYGQDRIRTPNIDRLAVEGMKFMNHYTGSTVCAPSRACLMTGYCAAHLDTTGQQQQLKDENITVAEILKRAGYATGIFGKWGLGENDTEGAPNKQGFDEWFGFLNQARAHFYYQPWVWENDHKYYIDANKDAEAVYVHDLFTERALQFIRKHKDEPFFLYFASTIPHAELAAPEKYVAEYRGKFEEVPYEATPNHGGPTFEDPHRPGYGYGSQPEPRATFAAMVTLLDTYVGRIMGLLKELGLDDNTLVLFGSDNGAHHEGGHDPYYFDSNGPFRGIKRDLYDGGIHTPFLARWPGKIEAGSKTEQICAYWDFLPTAAEIAGVPAPKGIDGISYLPTLLGKPEQQQDHDFLYWEMGNKQSGRRGKWKVVRYGIDKRPLPPVELFDLENDIGETKNLAGQYPEIASELDALLRKNANPNSEKEGYRESTRNKKK